MSAILRMTVKERMLITTEAAFHSVCRSRHPGSQLSVPDTPQHNLLLKGRICDAALLKV